MTYDDQLAVFRNHARQRIALLGAAIVAGDESGLPLLLRLRDLLATLQDDLLDHDYQLRLMHLVSEEARLSELNYAAFTIQTLLPELAGPTPAPGSVRWQDVIGFDQRVRELIQLYASGSSGPAYVLPGPNLRVDAEKRVRCLTIDEPEAQTGGASLDGLPAAGLCIGAEALVQVYRVRGQPTRQNVLLRLVPDVLGVSDLSGVQDALLVFPDGNFDGSAPKVAARWVEAGSVAEAAAGVPLLDPARTDYPANFLVQYSLSGQVYLFRTVSAGGPFPTPTDYTGTGNWQPVARQAGQQAVIAAYDLDYARYLIAPQKAAQPLLYLLTGNWNGAGPSRTVFVRGLPTPAGVFESEGELLNADGTLTRVLVNVGTGTYQAAGYSDVRARAAQLNRVAPAGTMTVTFAAESPTDYGTISSGTVVLDATCAQVGKVARFTVGPGASQPSYTGAPPEYFKKTGATWTSGTTFYYAALVCVDMIHVVIVAAA